MSLFSRGLKSYKYKGVILPFNLVPFTKYRLIGYIFSLVLTGLCIFCIFTKGFNWGLDFTGGTVVETHFSVPANLDKVRSTLKDNGINGAVVQTMGDVRDVMIRLPASTGNASVGNKIQTMLSNIDPKLQVQSVEFVGPNVGKELTDGAIYATLATLLMLLAYIGMRFEWRLGAGAIVALAHDIVVTLGVFSFFQIEMDLTFVAAILSVVGYSLNDSIVVFDRVRENFRKIRRVSTVEIVDISLTQTLARTLMTSLTTLFVVVALFLFGGPTIHSFSIALLVGIAFGTYSTIYIAISVALDLGLKREHMIIQKVDKDEIEEMP